MASDQFSTLIVFLFFAVLDLHILLAVGNYHLAAILTELREWRKARGL